MKKALAVLVASTMMACTSVDTATVSSNEIAANGEAVAVIQGTAIGISAILHFVDIIQADMDTAVNKLLVTEAKAMGASRVDLKYAMTTPRNGIWALYTCPGIILCTPMSVATGVAVK
jgi:hypothetical protein